ncbi:hypothetical protein [Myxosarcina sp. GI1(2024)]
MPINKSLFLTFATAFTVLGSGSLYESALAQYREPADSGYQSNEKDSLYGDGITGIDPVDLIHRANLRNSRTAEEFQVESQGQINNSAAEFKQLQEQRILEQQRSPNDETTAN